MTEITMKARVTGKVQGVAYRHWTRARAEQLGLTGWVRNDVSGAVEALFRGEKNTVQTMLDELWSGPGAASVRDVQARAAKADLARRDFRILH